MPVGSLKRLSALKYPQFGTFEVEIGLIKAKLWLVESKFPTVAVLDRSGGPILAKISIFHLIWKL